MYSNLYRKNDVRLRKTFLYIALFSVVPFLIIGIVGFTGIFDITALDYDIGAWFYNLRLPARTTIITGITTIGNALQQTLITIFVVLLLALFKKWRTALWYGITVLMGAGVLNSLVKLFFHRVRPDQIEHLIDQGGYSFPSGHSMGSMILFGGLLFVLVRFLKAKRWAHSALKWIVGILLALLILSIGLSRIYLGVHYPSDVVGGFSLGLSWLSLSIALFGLPITQKEFFERRKYHINTR